MLGSLQSAAGPRTAHYFSKVQTIACNVAGHIWMEMWKPLSKILESVVLLQDRGLSLEANFQGQRGTRSRKFVPEIWAGRVWY